jgi:sulfhydrogenase subunit delta
MIDMDKLRIGVYNITGCVGCVLSVIFNEKDLLDLNDLVSIEAFPFIKKRDVREFDVVLMEGTVTHNEDIAVLKEVRNRTKILVALGACSCTGGVPSFRNFIPYENYKHLVHHKTMNIADVEPKPIDAYVKVDHYLPGCPPDKNEILTFIKDMALGKNPKNYTKPVCMECRLNGNYCLLDKGRLCLGPVTRGGCNAICINGGFECWGCRGPTGDANYDAFLNMLKKKGFDTKTVKTRMKSFVGMKLEER